MSIERVRAYFETLGIADQIREFTVSSATVELAAAAVGVEGARIAKSLSFKVEERPILIVVAGDAKVDNSAYKKQFHTKAKMLTHQAVSYTHLAGKIHSDIERGFIRAEVIAYDDMIACGSVNAAKEKGLLRSEGKEYVVQDGDMVYFRFNV